MGMPSGAHCTAIAQIRGAEHQNGALAAGACACATLGPSVNCNRHPVIAMLDPKILEDIGARLSGIIAASPVADIEKNARALLSSAFARLDLVSREEFDIQTQLLQRTREKLQALEARLDRMENPPDQST